MARVRKSSDSLFRLVKSLSMNEKGYFKKYIQTQEGKKGFQYIRLFDIINKQDSYNEEKICQSFKGITTRDLSSLKGYLYNALLKSMTYYDDFSASIKIRKLLLEVEVLINKSLFDESKMLLLKALDLAEKHEYFPEMLEIYYDFFRLQSEPDITSLQKNLEHQKIVLNKHQNLVEYRTLLNKSYLLPDKDHSPLTKNAQAHLKEILKDPLLMDISSALSFRAKSYFYLIPATIHHIYLRDHKRALNYYKALIDLMETNDTIRIEIFHTYIDAVNGLLQCLLSLNLFSEYNSRKSLWSLVENKSSLVQSRVFEKNMLHETIYYLKTGQVKKGLAFLAEEDEKLAEYFTFNTEGNIEAEEAIIEPVKFQILLNIVVLNFYQGDFKKAKYYINKINLNSAGTKNYYIQSLSQIIHLLINLETEDVDFLKSRVNITAKNISKIRPLMNGEKLLLAYIKNYDPFHPRKISTTNLLTLKSELVQQFTDPAEKAIFEYFDVISWIDSKLKNEPLSELIKNK